MTGVQTCALPISEENISAVDDEESTAAIDELDSVLDGLTDDDVVEDDAIPQLEDEVLTEPEEDDLSLDDDDDFNLDDEDTLAAPDESAPDEDLAEPPEEDEKDSTDGEAAIDEALANLESELDDIDVDALLDDDEQKDQ